MNHFDGDNETWMETVGFGALFAVLALTLGCLLMAAF